MIEFDQREIEGVDMNLMRHLREKTEKSKQQGAVSRCRSQGLCVCCCGVEENSADDAAERGIVAFQTDILKQEKGRLRLQRKE